ncbi:MAG: MoxR family ATPase [Candidatus Wallbacteria bacterium]|nr:MoxR family ATPase [Candidatus Wallbacteria bacterium]
MDEKKLLEKIAKARELIISEVSKNIIGQERIVERVILSLFCQGHSLLEGVPGLAKTLLVKSIAQSLDLKFGRIQFTPDLMPSDITGSEIIEENENGKKEFRFHQGPVFANVVLADEINRTPPKTQAALLEAMQERTITINGKAYQMEEPFLVLATQNPIEQEGTYPLPEAQLDRFQFYLKVNYPTLTEEEEIVKKMTSLGIQELKPVLKSKEIVEIQKLIYKVPVADEVVSYAVRLARATRPQGDDVLPQAKKWIEFGVSPRAVQWLVFSAKAQALLLGKPAPGFAEIRELVPDVFRHRLVLNFQAEAEGITPDYLLSLLLSEIK